jgi:hypothetical protein
MIRKNIDVLSIFLLLLGAAFTNGSQASPVLSAQVERVKCELSRRLYPLEVRVTSFLFDQSGDCPSSWMEQRPTGLI